MARYRETASEAQTTVNQLYDLAVNGRPETMPERDYQLKIAELIARVMNYGVRCCPRPAQATVRLTALQIACDSLPIKMSMHKVTNENGYSYNRLEITPE